MPPDDVDTLVLGSHSKDPHHKQLAKALRDTKLALLMVAHHNNLGGGELIGVALSAIAGIPANRENREIVASVMEKWVEILRSDQEIHMTAAGNA